MKRFDWKFAGAILFAALAVYAAIACTVYQFRHPEQTETQRFLNIGDALTWKK